MSFIQTVDAETVNRCSNYLDKMSIKYRRKIPLQYETYFKKGGVVQCFVEPATEDEYISVIRFLNDNAIEFKVVGFTSNLYFLDELEYGILISTKQLRKLIVNKQEQTIEVEAGYPLEDFVRVALVSGGVGFEGLEGIPATIGGAIFMNAGAYGFSISDCLLDVKVMDKSGSVDTLSKSLCHFSFRESIFKQNKDLYIISARFRYEHGSQETSVKAIRTYHIARHIYQEFAYPSLGSLFSVKRSFYDEVFRKSFLYRKYYFALKLLLNNPISKLFRRKNPNNTVFNALFKSYGQPEGYGVSVSEKSLNILINDGVSSYAELNQHIKLLKSYLKKSTPIENEVVIEALSDNTKNKQFLKELNEGEL
jgi:UDP-N-acetylmuramate dehydrogenase